MDLSIPHGLVLISGVLLLRGDPAYFISSANRFTPRLIASAFSTLCLWQYFLSISLDSLSSLTVIRSCFGLSVGLPVLGDKFITSLLSAVIAL